MNFSEISGVLNAGNVPKVEEIGRVISVADGIVRAFGIFDGFMGEVVVFSKGARGMIMSMSENFVDIIVFGDFHEIREGEIVKRTKKLCVGPYGEGILGRVVNGLGDPIDDLGALDNVDYRDIEYPAPGIMDRQSIHEPLYTGTLAIDSSIAIGRGQRELVIGDRQTGKSTLAMNMILNQKIAKFNGEQIYCIYVAIGQKMSHIARFIKELKDNDAMKYSVVVAATAADSAAEQFVAPYIGCLIGEWFRDNGKHALVIYDDLSKHAVAYRELSLLLRRSPGREAYPGDVFYIHSRLLERAGKLSDARGSGSLTAIPIIETRGGDVSGYIPTNVISITDGQIILDKKKFNNGIMPPINLPLSVTRVGSAAQENIIKKLSNGIKSMIAQYEELREFVKFSSTLDSETERILNKGAAIEAMLRQRGPIGFAQMVVMLFSYQEGYLERIFIRVGVSGLLDVFEEFIERGENASLITQIEKRNFDKDVQEKLKDALELLV